MFLFTRRYFLASGLFSTVVPSAANQTSRDLAGEPSLPRLRWSISNQAHIDLEDLLPSREAISRFEELALHARKSRRLVVHVKGEIAPIDGYDPRLSEWIILCERSSVSEVIETSARSSQVTPPIRVGQIDPAGIVYRINAANSLA